MITEDYVSFETAKLLKEKGFDGKCYKVWETHGGSPSLMGAAQFVEGETVVDRESVDAAAKLQVYEYHLLNKVEGYLAPTLQMAMKWLREVHKMFIQVELYSKYENYCFELFQNTHRLMLEHREVYSNYEEVCEAAIMYCLENLI